MKITDITIDVIKRNASSVPVQDNRGDLGGVTTQGVLRVISDQGIEGHCLVGEQGADATQQMRRIIDTLKPVMIGKDPSEREWLWHKLAALGGHGMPLQPAWAPLDVALWDITGKEAGLPVHRLLGTVRSETPLYATYPPRHADPEGFVAEALQLKSEGFSAYKIHPGPLTAPAAAATADKVREAVGDNMHLMLDRNHGYSYEEALIVGRALDSNGFYWFEDPLPVYEHEAIGRLSGRLDTPLNMSDSATFLFREAAHFLALGHIRMVRGTVRKLGITGLKKLCSMVEGFGKKCEIGLAGNSAMNAANLHVIMSVPNTTFYEYWRPESVHQWGVHEEIRIDERGMVAAPDGPGLGIELDEEWIAAHRLAVLS